jgi:hypothetical protein
MRIPGRIAAASLLLALTLLLGAAWVQPAAASEAAVVVRHGDGSITYAMVVFPEEEITSFDLLDRSTLSLTTVAFGGLGEAVCTLDGEGCPVTDCQRRLCQTGDPESPFWQFFRPGADGAWESQPLGASSSRVGDGDVDVWSWTGGAAYVPPLDITAVASLLGVSLDQVEGEAVYVDSFDSAGNRIERGDASGSGRVEILAGVAALLLLAGVAVLLAMRRRGGLRESAA